MVSDPEQPDIRADPAYAEGFWDARDLESLFPDADPAYAAGWQAYWNCRAILTNAATV